MLYLVLDIITLLKKWKEASSKSKEEREKVKKEVLGSILYDLFDMGLVVNWCVAGYQPLHPVSDPTTMTTTTTTNTTTTSTTCCYCYHY